MPRRQKAQYIRHNRPQRPAFLPDIQRLKRSDLPHQFCHPWAKGSLDDLSPAAMTVFIFLCALARTGRKGYPGVAVADELVCEIVRKITGRKCGLSTWRNGRRELDEKGFCTRTYWTRPDQRIRNGKRVVVVPGSSRVNRGGDEWCSKQIRITLLTPEALALFDKSTRLESTEVLSCFPTPLKNDARPLVEDSTSPTQGASACLESTTRNDVGSQHQSHSMLDLEGNPTCPSSSTTSSSSTGEQRPLTPDLPAHQNQTPTQPIGGEASDKASRFGPSSSWSGSRGCSAARPALRGAPRKKERAYALTRLLNVMHQCLANYPTPQADEIFSRAQTELALTDYSNWPTVMNLPYWLSRAPKMTRRELFGYMRARIIPALKYSGPVVPKERRRYRQWTEPSRTAAQMAAPVQHMPGWLKNFAESVGSEKN